MCNLLLSTAVRLARAGRAEVDQAVAIVLPVSALVAAATEHSIPNTYLFPLDTLLQRGDPPVVASVVTLAGMAGNLLPAIAGNLLGGSVLMGVTHRLIHSRQRPARAR